TGLRHSMITLALGARRYDLALDESRRARAFTPGDRITTILQSYALLLSGEAEHCLALDLAPWPAERAMCLLELGRTAEADRVADSLAVKLRGGSYRSVAQFADLAAYRARRGDVAGAIEWLAEGAKISPMLYYWHLDSGLFDRVRNQPEFRAGIRRVEESIRARMDEERRALSPRLE
ncbi:MAG TPA: hypothetical protein VEB59_10100, partial [Gemmatimonadales bacterium]|nr:hypothetical protein [Gemmatimonadales bacterium]